MTVAAVMHFASPEDALLDTAGRPAVRRMVEAAWAGGATPIVVVADERDGRLAAALAGSVAILAQPAPSTDLGVQLLRGARIAAERVSETDALLLWPGSMTWVDAETVTSLIEAHGAERDAVLRPLYGNQPGWPVLVPHALVAGAAQVGPAGTFEDAVAGLTGDGRVPVLVDTGDPGTVFDRATPIDALPQFEGPPQPAAGPPPEWGASAADSPDDDPLQGPALAPYGQAADETGG